MIKFNKKYKNKRVQTEYGAGISTGKAVYLTNGKIFSLEVLYSKIIDIYCVNCLWLSPKEIKIEKGLKK